MVAYIPDTKDVGVLRSQNKIIETTKKAIVDYYNKYVNLSIELDRKILKMIEPFKEDDFLLSILYNKLIEQGNMI